MVGSSKRSPSPVTSKLPRSLQSQENQPIRRSFNTPSHLTNPTNLNFSTPANSPAEIGRRNSRGGDEKENEKGQILKAGKLRSPSNGSKNFMAPTISAASKFTPSPRKSILVERNDHVRTSITLSDGKATFFSTLTSEFERKTDFCLEEKNSVAAIPLAVASSQEMKPVSEVPIVPKPFKKVTFKDVKFNPDNSAQSFVEKVSINSDSEPNPDKSSVELSNISLSCPPHELKSNILSNPKIDVVKGNVERSDSGESKQLEDSCLCELPEKLSFSEGQSEKGNSWEMLENLPSSEALPVSTPIADSITEDTIIPKQTMEPVHPMNWKSVCLALVLLGTFILSATNFPTMHSFVPKYLNFELPELSQVAEIAKLNLDYFAGKSKQWSADFMPSLVPKDLKFELPELSQVAEIAKVNLDYFAGKSKQWSADFMPSFVPRDLNFELPELSEVAEIAKVNLDEFVEKVKQWSDDSISYLYNIVLPVLELDKMGPSQFRNLTILEDDDQISSFCDANSGAIGFEEDFELKLEEAENEEEAEDDNEMEEVGDVMKEVEQEIEKVEDEIEEVEDGMKEEKETHISSDCTIHLVSSPDAPDTDLETETSEDDHILAETGKSHKEIETEPFVASIKLKNQKGFSDMISLDTTQLKVDVSEFDYYSYAVETDMLLGQNQPRSSLESQESFSEVGSKEESSQIPKGPGSSSGETRIQAQIVLLGTFLVLLKLGTVALLIFIKHLSKNTSTHADASPPICNKKIIKFVQKGESCASEMSSSRKSLSSHQRKGESLVYSSEYSFGSPLYGSFTTYETIPSKHADGDEEIMTPVRRSSRIRKQVTSPQ